VVINERAKATSVTLTADDLSDPAALERCSRRQGQYRPRVRLRRGRRYPTQGQPKLPGLQTSWTGPKNRINVARQRYNQARKKRRGEGRDPKNLKAGRGG